MEKLNLGRAEVAYVCACCKEPLTESQRRYYPGHTGQPALQAVCSVCEADLIQDAREIARGDRARLRFSVAITAELSPADVLAIKTESTDVAA